MSQDQKTEKPWGGRFTEATDAFVERFTASVTFDKRLYRADIAGSIAHATMLATCGILTDSERQQIVDGLEGIRTQIEAGEFNWSVSLEDVHMNIESALTEKNRCGRQETAHRQIPKRSGGYRHQALPA